MSTSFGMGVGIGAPFMQAHARVDFQFVPLSDHLHIVTGTGGNMLVAITSEGLLMVDSGSPNDSKDLLSQLKAKYNAPVKALFNTHWHIYHTGANELLAKQGATIIAHENTKLWMSTEIISRSENHIYPPRVPQARPTQTFYYDAKPFTLGNRTVEYGWMPQAHTDGDIYVQFADENVLMVGGVVPGDGYPSLDYSTNGWLGGMIQALKLLLQKSDTQTRIVSGSAQSRTRADLQSQLEMCTVVLGRINDSYYKGESWTEFVTSKPTREFDAKWGQPDLFLRNAYQGAWGHITDIRRFL